jgi:hypothetical protein
VKSDPPVFTGDTSVIPYTLRLNNYYSIPLDWFTDPDGDALTYRTQTSITGMSIVMNDGIPHLQGYARTNYASYNFRLEARDGDNGWVQSPNKYFQIRP